MPHLEATVKVLFYFLLYDIPGFLHPSIAANINTDEEMYMNS